MSTSNLKISIAALSLCVSAVAIYIHLPYVIAAVSGSGAIEAVPLAIFAVSAIVALVSVIYLIRLAVSRAGDKKKIDFSGEEELGSRGRQQQNLVEGGRINTWKKTSEDMDKKEEMAKLEIEMVKVGVEMANLSSHIEEKQDSRSQMDVAKAIPQNNNASLPSPSGGPPPPPPLPSSFQNSPTQPGGASLFAEIGSVKLNKADGSGKKPSSNNVSNSMLYFSELGKELKSMSSARQKSREEQIAKIEEEREEKRKKQLSGQISGQISGQRDDVFNKMIGHKLLERRGRLPSSDSNLSGPPDSNGWGSNGDEEQDNQSFAPPQADAPIEEQDKQSFAPAQADAPEATDEIDSDGELRNYENEPLNSQPDNKRESTDSGFEDRFRPISPVDPEQKTEESPVPPGSRVDSPSAVQVNNVNPVDNKVQDPSTSSIKDHRKFFDSIGGVANPSK